MVNQLILRSPAERRSRERQAFVYEQPRRTGAQHRATKDEIGPPESALAEMLSARQIADTQNQITALEQKLNTLQANYASLLATTQRGAVNTINVVEPANLPAEPMPSKLLINMLLAAHRLRAGRGAAYLLEYLDDSVRSAEDIQKVLDVPALGACPNGQGPARRRPGDGEQPAVAAVGSLSHPAHQPPVRLNRRTGATLLVTSADPSEGKTITVANLAVALAQAPPAPSSLDCDMHRPRLHRIFNAVNNVERHLGAAQRIARPDVVLAAHRRANLRIMTTGPLPPNSPRFRSVRSACTPCSPNCAQADFVLVDSPPVLALSDAGDPTQDGVLLVGACGAGAATLKRPGVLRQVNANWSASC